MVALDSTLGAVEIGVLLSIFLYGIATVQVFLYSQSTYKDPLPLRLLVGVVWVFETVHTVSICILLYSLTVTNYGVPEKIADASLSLVLSAVLSAWIGALIQAFFAYRVKIISNSWFLPIVSWSLSALRAALGVVIGVLAVRAKTLTRYIHQDQWLVTLEFAVCAVIDVLNTSALCYYLMRRRHPLSHKLVDKIMLWSIETGLLTSVTVLVMLICSLTMPTNLIYIGLLMPYAKMFSNSFLTSLNARRTLRQMGEDVKTTQTPSGGMMLHPSNINRAAAAPFELVPLENDKAKVPNSAEVRLTYSHSSHVPA